MSLFEAKTAKNQDNPARHSHITENGSAFVWIFLMIGLVAALYFIVGQGFRAGETSLSKEKTELYATEILDYAQSIKQVVQTLQINGCDETEISFDNPVVTIYNFPSTPADESCKVFKPNGGGLTYLEPNNDYIDPSIPYFIQLYHTEWSFFGRHCIAGIGNCDSIIAQLQMNLAPIKDEICIKINEIMGDTSGAVPFANWSVAKGSNSEFNGSYSDGNGATRLSNTVINGKMAGCYQDDVGSADGYNVFYQVLLVR